MPARRGGAWSAAWTLLFAAASLIEVGSGFLSRPTSIKHRRSVHAVRAAGRGGGSSVEDDVREEVKSLVTLKSGAFNRTIPVVLLNRAMDASLGTTRPLPGNSHDDAADGEGEGGVQHMTTPHGHLLSPFHPVFGRWELAFVSLKGWPAFYVPVPNMITLTRDGPGRIEARATAFNAQQVHVPLGAFTVTENSTRAGRPVESDEGSSGIIYGMQLSSIKPGKKVFDLVLYKEDDELPVLAVRSTDGEESWLLISVEARMRRRDENVRKYAREILNLERQAQGGDGSRDNLGGYKVMREVWTELFRQVDEALGTRLASNRMLLGVSPFLPILLLGLVMFLSAPGHFGGQMSFLHH